MFTIDELTIVKMYSGFSPDRDKVIAALKDSIQHIDDPDIKNTVSTVIRKCSAMTKDAFAAINLSDAMDEISPIE